MEQLPEKINTQSVALAVYNPPPGTKAIEIRRQMVQLPEVAKSLSSVEKYILRRQPKHRLPRLTTPRWLLKPGKCSGL